MDFIPPPNRDDFKDQKEYEAALKEGEKEIKKFSDKLIVSVTSDKFVNKGPGRPIFSEKLRIEFLQNILNNYTNSYTAVL